MAEINGTSGNDNLVGTALNDNINGFAGDDIINSGDGDDTISGGLGNDTINGGDGNDQIFGNGGGGIDGNDIIHGDNGNDTIYGSGGVDQLYGDDGNDVISTNTSSGMVFGGAGDDLVYLDAQSVTAVATTSADGGAGIDTLDLQFQGTLTGVTVDLSSVWAGGNGVGPGNGVITGFERFARFMGSEGNDRFTLGASYAADSVVGGVFLIDGRDGNDTLVGGSGKDWIRGGIGDDDLSGLAGDDFLVGDAGNDILRGGNGNDQLSGGNGNDVLIGGDGDDVLNGDGDNDVLVGGIGNDTLDGGTGSNEIYGGTGNDIYIVSNAGDSIIEFANEGIDEIRTALAALTLASNVENLGYTGAATFLGIGNALGNAITGGAGRDQLAGLDGNDTLDGGSMAAGQEDVLLGGLGNDIYVTALRGTSIVEYANEGIDEVRASSSVFVLPANVENLTYTGSGGFIGFGNALDNVITGGTGADGLVGDAGNDTIDGGAGAANELIGGTGNDIYIVRAGGDTIIEFANEGTDTVQTALTSYTLRPNVENLVYTGGGSFAGVGSAENNAITGGAGADTLSGLDGNDILTGGASADLLIGGNGADQFRYLGGETGYDRIIDFTPGSDQIALALSGFARTATVAFVSGAGAVAGSTNSTFLYDTNTGIVSYDADGTGAGAAVQLAQLNTGLALSAADFIFF